MRSMRRPGWETRVLFPGTGGLPIIPWTPDVAGELQKSVGDAADSKRLKIPKDEAVKRLHATLANLELSIIPGQTTASGTAPAYPDPDELNDYYADEGPPVYTYYNPPPDYYYLYEFIPYPFWWYDLWFPGILRAHRLPQARVLPRQGSFLLEPFQET